MWMWLVIQGAIGGLVLLWFAIQDWPTNLLGALIALPFPALFIFGGLAMRHRESDLKPKRKAYLEANAAAREELNRARFIKWGTPVAVTVGIIAAFSFIPLGDEGEAAFVWIAASVTVAAIMLSNLYSWHVQQKVEEAARVAAGEQPLTPEAKRTVTVWAVAALVLIVGIVAFDQFVESPVSAMTVFLYGALIFGAVAFAWRKLNPPREK